MGIPVGYQALHDAAAWFDVSDRGRIRVTGEDRARLLHAMATQHIQQLKPGEGAYSFFLNAQGRILFDANIFCFEDYILLDTEPETRAKLLEHLDKFIIADDVTLEDVTESLAAIDVAGPQANAVLTHLGASIPAADDATQAWGDRVIARLGPRAIRVFVPTTDKPTLIALLNVPQASADDIRTIRIEHGIPRYGEEITERYLVPETAQLQAVNFNKGCYLGQEIVERVRSRGQVHRVLRKLEIDSAQVPEAGLKFKMGDADAGEIASAVLSPASGKVVALAYMRTAFAEPGARVQVNGAEAKVV